MLDRILKDLIRSYRVLVLEILYILSTPKRTPRSYFGVGGAPRFTNQGS